MSQVAIHHAEPERGCCAGSGGDGIDRVVQARFGNGAVSEIESCCSDFRLSRRRDGDALDRWKMWWWITYFDGEIGDVCT